MNRFQLDAEVNFPNVDDGSRKIPDIVHVTTAQDSRKFVNLVLEGEGNKNLSVSMKCSTGTEISVAFVGFQGRCYVFDVKSHPALMREEAGLRSLLADGEVTKVRRKHLI